MSAALPRLILASGSPRRSDILGRLGLDFEVRVPKIEERLRPGESPAASAERLARKKAAAEAEAGALALGCDTLVAHAGEALGKPGSREEAVEMIVRLAGDRHTVYTGIALAEPGRMESAIESTVVRFRPLSRNECEEYVDTGEPMDKAGAYGIQGFGAALVEGIEGDYFNVMGMPVGRLLELLGRFGWRYAFGRLVVGE